jgi:hypothetical protein
MRASVLFITAEYGRSPDSEMAMLCYHCTIQMKPEPSYPTFESHPDILSAAKLLPWVYDSAMVNYS